MNRVLRWLLALGTLAVLFGLSTPANAQKVGNPGTFNFRVDSGLMKVKTQEFPFDDSQNINFNGTVDKAGNINIPSMTFPDFPISASGFNLTVKINVVNPTTGTINPLTGAASLRLKVWIKIDGVPLGGGCKIASASSPVDVNALITGTSGSGGNVRTGTPYNLSTGQIKLVNATFGVPASDSCGIAGGTVDDTVGLPSPAGNNAAEFNITTTPKLTRGVTAALTASPTSGTAPFTTTLNAGGSSVIVGPASYKWDFTNDGTIDQTTAVPTVSHTYTAGGTPTARVVVTDAEGDSAEATRQLTVNAYPDLKLTSDHNDPFRVGNVETYRVNLQNVGYAATSGTTTVSSTLPAGLTYDSVTGSGWGCSTSGQDLTCSRAASIPVGGSAPELGVKLKVGAAARPSVAPTFTVTTPGDNGPGNNQSTETTQITATDLKLNLDHQSHAILLGPDPANVITLSAENIGDAATVGQTVIEDDLPAGLTPVSAAGPGWSCNIAGQKVTCTRAAVIAPGASTGEIELAVSGSLDPGVIGVTVNNQATVTTADDVDPTNDTKVDPTLILNGQDLGVTKSHSGSFTAGQNGSYTIDVHNYGTVATTGPATVTDVLPTGLTFVSADGGPHWNCAESSGTVTCTHLDPVAAGADTAPIDLTVAVGVDAIPTVTNTAGVTTADDPNPANDSFADETIVQAIDLAITKTHTGSVGVGRNITYKLAVKNEGDSPTTGPATVTDVLPTGLTFVSADGGPDWDCAESGGTVTCEHAGLLAAGQSAADVELTVAVAPAAAPEVTNTASVSTGDDFNPANDSDDDTAVVIEADTGVTIGRTGSLKPGKNATYQVTVRNHGAIATTGPTEVVTELADGLEFVSATGTGWSCNEDDGTVTCTRPAGLPGDTTAPAIMIKVLVTPATVSGVETTVSAATPDDRNPDNDQASDVATFTTLNLAIDADSLGPLRIGDIGAVHLDVSNNGTGATTDPVTVTDVLPAGLEPISAVGPGWDCDVSGQTVTCLLTEPLGSGAAAGQITIEVKATDAALTPGETAATVTNQATVETDFDPDLADNTVEREIELNGVDLAIDATGPAEIASGDVATWNLQVENSGSASTTERLRVTANLPAGFAPQNSGGTGWICTSAGQTVKCDYSQPTAPGETLPGLAVRARAGNVAGPVAGQATVEIPGDLISANDSANFNSEVTVAPDLAVSLEARSASARVGADAGYELKLRNVGTAAAAGPTTLTIDLPAGADFVGLDHGQDFTCDAAGSQVSCEYPDAVDPDEILSLGFRLSYGAATGSQAQVTATVLNSADPNPANNVASTVNAIGRIDLALSRSQQGPWVRNATGSYRLDLENLGSAPTSGPIVITETLPYGTTLATATGDHWSCTVSGRVLRCERLEPIQPGDSSALDITLDVAREATTPVSASSTVATDGDVNPANDTATSRIDLEAASGSTPGIARVKPGRAAVTSGGTVTVWISCPATAPGKCRGTLSLKTVGKVKVAKVGKRFRKARINLGKADYSVAAGRSAPVQVQLGKQGRKALKLNRKFAVKATAAGSGVAATSARIVIGRGR